MKKVAILIDGGWFKSVLRAELTTPGQLERPMIKAATIFKNAVSVIDHEGEGEEIFRIYYYDARPYDGTDRNPIDGELIDFSKSKTYRYGMRVIEELGQMDQIALRIGDIKPRGWALTDSYIKQAIKNTRSVPPAHPPLLNPQDIYPSLEQKGVDMRIGIDVANLALQRHVDRIILLSGDTDMIPAMKLARRAGIQVILVQFGGHRIVKELIEDADFLRKRSPLP